MSTLQIGVLDQLADSVLLRLTIDEAERLGLPLVDRTVDVRNGSWHATARWDARDLALTVPVDQPAQPHRQARLSRHAEGGLQIAFASQLDTRSGRQSAAGNDVRSALSRGHYTEQRDLELAAEVSAHRARSEYRSRRLASSSVSPSGWRWSPDPAGPDHRLLIGPQWQRMSLAVDWSIEALNSGRVRRVYLAVPPDAQAGWLSMLDQAATHLDAGVARAQISIVTYRRLASWQPSITGACLLVVDGAEQATRRWPDRIPRVLQRATGSLSLGDPASDQRTPDWAIDVLEALGDRAGITVLPPPTAPILQRFAYRPSPEEQRARRDLAASLSGTPGCLPWHPAWMGIFGACWRGPAPGAAPRADEPRLQAVLDACQEGIDSGARVELAVASLAAADELRRRLPEKELADGSLRMRVGSGAPPVDPEAQLVYADLTALVRRPAGLTGGIVVCASGTGDDTLFALVQELTALTTRQQGDLDRLVNALPRRWSQLAVELLLGSHPPDQLLATARQRRHHHQQRATRLAGDLPLPATPDPHLVTRANSALLGHAALIAETLDRLEVGVGLAETGTGVLRVTATVPQQTFPPGTRLLLEPDTTTSKAPSAPLFAGTPGAERLFHRALQARVSMEVSDLPEPLDLPVTPHAERLHLVSRRYLPPRSVEVEGRYLDAGAPTPTTTTETIGEAVRTGRKRRPIPVSIDDPGIPETSLLESLVDQLEARASAGRRLLTARFVAGDDVGLEERWRRSDGTELILTCPAPLVGAPVFVDPRGALIRELDTCDAGHPTDAASIERCTGCHAERCPSCQDAGVRTTCGLCASGGCPTCVTGGLCPSCRQPRRTPELDQPGFTAWQVPGARVSVGRSMVTVHREDRGDPDVHVPDDQCTAELDVRRRGLLHEHGLALDTPVLIEPVPELDDATGVLTTDEHGEQWVVLDAPPRGCDPVADTRLLGSRRGPAVRPLSALGIGPAWLRERHQQAPLPAGRCLVLRRHVDRSELSITTQGLRWSTIRHQGDGTLVPIEVQRVDLSRPITPRNDHDGRLIAVGRIGEVTLELLALNASAVLRVRRFGVTQDYFAPVSSTASHGSEAAWHALARSYSVADDVVLVAPKRALRGARPARFADPSAARLVERTVIPFATFAPPAAATRPIVHADLAPLQRQVVELGSTTLKQAAAKLLRQLLISQLPTPSRPLQVGISFTVNEEWLAAGRRELAYRVRDGDPALPPLDDTGEPGEQFTVDSAGHLHLEDNGHACEACQRHYCTACPPQTQLADCADCHQPACGPCRTEPRQVRSTAVEHCARCSRRSCGSCGRDLHARSCACCNRELCRWCVPDGVACCTTCAQLAPGFDGPVPETVPVAGCTLLAASDQDAQVVGLHGAQRREVLVLRGGELVRWASFEPDLRVTVSVIGAARRWERDLRIDGFAREDGPLHEPSETCVWSRLTSELEIGPRNQERLRVDFTDRDLLDTLADALGDGGPYPVPAADDPGLPPQLHRSGSGRTLRLVRRDARVSIEVDREGLLRREDRWHPRRSTDKSRGGWRPSSTDADGRARWIASLDPVQATLLTAGRDVELHIRTDSRERTQVLSESQADRCMAQLLHAAGWESPASTAVTAVLLPADAAPLAIAGRALENRQLSLRARVSDSTTSLPAETVLDACARLGWQPTQHPPELLTSRFAGVTERFATEPTSGAILGLAVHETFAGGIDAEYEMWPHGTSTRYEHQGMLVRQLAIDISGHVVTAVEVCRYCSSWTCSACERAVRGCDVCGIKLCRACAPPFDFRICPACFRLATAPIWASRRLFLRPKPWRFVQGQDVRHHVTIGRSSTGLRLVSRGDHHVNDVPLTPTAGLAIFLGNAFERNHP